MILRILIAGVVIVGLAIAAAWQFWPRRGLSAQDRSVMLVRAEQGDFEHEITERGEVESASNVEVRCEVEAKGSAGTTILEIVPEGTQVDEGDVLVRLDSSKLESDLTQQQIVCNTSEAEVIKARNDYETALIARQEYIEGQYKQEEQTIQSEIFVAEEDLRRAQEYLAYSERLAAKGYVTTLQLEADRFAVDKARNELDMAKNKLDVLRKYTREKELKQFDSDIKTSEAKLRSEEDSHRIDLEELERIKEQIAKCTIRAPEPGQVVYANVTNRRGGQEVIIEPGTQVRENQVIIRLPDPKRMQVKAEINEAKVTKVAAGMTATVRLDAFPDAALPGTVQKVNEYPEPSHWFTSSTKEYATIVSIDESPVGLRPGLTAEVKILVQRKPDVLMLPVQAVFEHGERFYCAVPGPQGFEPRRLELGPTNDKRVVINGGLSPGDRVALNAAALRDDLDLPEVAPRDEKPTRPASRKPTDDVSGTPTRKPSPAKPTDGVGGTGGKHAAGASPDDRFAQLDKNNDGQLQRDEVPGPMRGMFERVDTDGDGAISRAELQAAMAKMRSRNAAPSADR